LVEAAGCGPSTSKEDEKIAIRHFDRWCSEAEVGEGTESIEKKEKE